uniref:Cytochrome c oxidase subunit 2 n=1 Tax=Habroteleia persimilis TaxID=2496286 RepID=A0A3S8V174_9HYME|nr:cytochrome c oxidase subunit 2 [Habroteleia persimilis]
MMSWSTLNFQDSMSPIMFYMNFFHEFIMMFILFILMMIIYLMYMMILNKFYSNKIINHQMIETIWTILPLMILFFLAIPSIKILYLTDEIKLPKMSIKSIGNQWYWSYEYPQFKNLSFDSYMLNTLNNNSFRLLEVDNRLIIPTQIKIRILSTSNDVIHSFTIPSMGFKIDSIPGRMNQTTMFSNYPGIFFGQCSEICGINHSLMPIMMETISMNNFIKWINKNI